MVGRELIFENCGDTRSLWSEIKTSYSGSCRYSKIVMITIFIIIKEVKREQEDLTPRMV